MDYLSFLFATLHVYQALCEEIFWDTTVKLAKNMSLECLYPSVDSLTQMEWFKINTTEKQSMAIFNPTFGVIMRKPYADKVYFTNSTMASNDLTLAFHNASEADVGFYSCCLHTFPNGLWKKVIWVVQSDSFELTAPSDHHIVSESGKNVTLTCHPRMKGLMQLVTWEKIQPRQIDRLTLCNLSQGRSYTSKYHRQIVTNCSQGLAWSIIVLPYATVTDSGLYRCCFKARTGENETFVMRLTVNEGNTNHRYILLTAGGAALLLLLAILITTFTLSRCNRRRRQKRVRSKDLWDTWNKPPKNRSAVSNNQPLEGSREDIYVNYPTFSHRPKTR